MSEQPDIVWIVADDLGTGDIGEQASHGVPLPNIEALRLGGVNFSGARAAACICSPARAALLSGRAPHWSGVDQNVRSKPPGGVTSLQHGIDPRVPLVPQSLRSAGYFTGCVGKWHLGLAPEAHPLSVGFDYFYGFLAGGRSYGRRPRREDAQAMRLGRETCEEPDSVTDSLGVESARFLSRRPDQPAFLYLSFSAPHVPLTPLPEDLAGVPANLDPERRAYLGLMVALDRAVGDVLAALEARDRGALVIFTSDHGGKRENGGSNGSLRGDKGTLFEGGLAVPLYLSWAGRLPAGVERRGMVSHLDLAATSLAAGWGKRLPRMEGIDLVTASGAQLSNRRFHWELAGVSAIVEGPWKLIHGADLPRALFNLARDPSEQHNLLEDEPVRVSDLGRKLAAWRAGLPASRWPQGPNQAKACLRRHGIHTKAPRPSRLSQVRRGSSRK